MANDIPQPVQLDRLDSAGSTTIEWTEIPLKAPPLVSSDQVLPPSVDFRMPNPDVPASPSPSAA